MVKNNSKKNPWLVIIKPNLVLMVVFSTFIGYFLTKNQAVFSHLILLFLGVFLSASAAHIFNQIVERKSDAIMKRTLHRPLVKNTISIFTALMGGIIFLVLGLFCLFVIDFISALFTALTVFLYVAIYTPLKKISSWNTWVGALPGALPILIGFYAAKPVIHSFVIWIAFLLLYVWQIPHFLSLAWKYKEDYSKANFKMFVIGDKTGNKTAIIMLLHCLILLALVITDYWFYRELLPFIISLSCTIYFLYLMLRFLKQKSIYNAQIIFNFSLFYLPIVLVCFIISDIIN